MPSSAVLIGSGSASYRGRGRSGVTGPTATFPKCAANPGARSAHTV